MVSNSVICPMCQIRYVTDKHHLIFGSSNRRLADQDKLTIRLCSDCHTAGALSERIHDNMAAEALSKMLGQCMFERNKCAEGFSLEQARKEFKDRYGLSFL